jgi:hypothetical protein
MGGDHFEECGGDMAWGRYSDGVDGVEMGWSRDRTRPMIDDEVRNGDEEMNKGVVEGG